MTRRSAALELVLALSFCHVALAQQTGTFTPTGNMTTPSYLHTATLLADGRVLIAGGDSPYSTLSDAEARAELYDPVTGIFSPTGSMTTQRDGHTATLLPNGKVLIAGGGPRIRGGGYSLASAEIYDPATGSFTATGSMTVERTFHTATLLNNGKVLIAGGLRRIVGGAPSDYSFPRGAELYDPDTGTFTATGDMSRPFADTSTLLPNGTVLITRGNPEGPAPYLSSAELYDPATGTFSFAGYLTTNHTGPTAVLLTDGNVLVAGGDVGDGDWSSNIGELFNPATGVFGATGNMILGREQNTATLLRDGTVLFTGGHIRDNASAELYDSATGAFRMTGSMATGRELHTATLLNDGTVLVTGGDRYLPTALASAEIYTPAVLVPASIATDLQFDRMNVVAGSCYSTILSGSNLTPETFFDVRFTSPGSNESGVALNWQRGLAETHDVPADIALGSWVINGVRAHQIKTDHTGSFIPISRTITVSPAIFAPTSIVADLQFDRPNVVAGSSYSTIVSGSNLTPETFFDVRFISPASNESGVALNWQRGLAERHDVPADIALGPWVINGVRAHQIETDHTGCFIPVSATITVSR